jgi:FkbM family methyltransferase
MGQFTQYRITAANTLRLLGHSWRLLPFKTWVACWLPLRIRKNLVLDSFIFSLRNNRMRDAIVDLAMALSCFHDQQYNPTGFELKEGDAVVDIGGHIGSFALHAASEVGQRGRVLVYEPSPDNHTHLRHNIAQSGFSNVQPFATAIAGTKGNRQFFSNPMNMAMHNFYQKGNYVSYVSAITLADVFAEHQIERCNFLKIDCEGAEYEILYNTPKHIFDRIDRIAMEYHQPPFYGLNANDHDPERLASFLRDAGFSVRMQPENRMHGLLFASRGLASR